MAARSEKTKRSGIAEILQAFKKNKTDRDSRSWDWANKDLTASFGLHEGDKICVKYEYEDIIFVEQDSDGGREPVDASETGAQDVHKPIAEDANKPVLTSPTADEALPLAVTEEIEGADSPLKPGEYVCGCKIVWWPAVIQRYDDAKTGKYSTLKEVYELVRSELDKHQREKIEGFLEEKGDCPVWQVTYEARDTTASETIPVFFLSSDSLMHLHSQWAQGTFKSANAVSDPSELADEPIFAGQTALEYAMRALQKSLTPTEAVENLDEAGEGEGTDVEHEEEGDSDPALKAAEAAVMSHFAEVLRSFSKELVENKTDCVSPDDVWRFFSSLKPGLSADDRKAKEEMRPLSEGRMAKGDDDVDDLKRGILESDPFPRLGGENTAPASGGGSNDTSSPPARK